jgi:hypothetical protein
MAMVIRSSCNPAIITCFGCARLVEEEEEKYRRIEEGMLFLPQLIFMQRGLVSSKFEREERRRQ